MTISTAAVATRLLGPALTLTGASGTALGNVVCDTLPDGAICFVLSESAFYRLAKFSLAALDGTRVIATVRGASAQGRWVQVTGDESIEPLPTMIFCDSHFTGTPTGSIAAPWPTLQQALDAVPSVGGGSILMAVGTYPDAWVIPAKTVNIYAIGGAQGGAGGGVVLPGGQLTSGAAVRLENVAFTGAITLNGAGSLYASQVGFSNQNIVHAGLGNWTLRMFSDGLEPSDPGDIDCFELISRDIEFQGNISVSGPMARILRSSLENDLTFTGAPGQLITDLETLNVMRINGALLVNGTTLVLDAPTIDTTVAVPEFVAAGTATADVAFPDAEPGDTFAIAQAEAMPANAALGQPFCPASDVVRIPITAVGAVVATDVDVAITRFNGGF